jgi:group I intron endonuclease
MVIPNLLLKREQYYIDLLIKEYNILKRAGSSLGYKHTEETRAKISSSITGEKHPMFGKQHSEETRTKMSSLKVGEQNPMFGKKHSD